MARQVLIIHGWSDTSRSFRSLASFLVEKGFDAKVLWLGDYISMDDDVGVADVAKRMGEVIDAMIQSGELNKSFDMIVHSTGGLVARRWLTSRYRGIAETCPLKRLVMLAPANYGSKLATAGKSLLGRVVKGYNNWFQTGQTMLNDLELGSSFQWNLAQQDILLPPGGDPSTYYGDDRVWPFVIVGTHPYASLLRQIVNENGSDGTVRVCAANLNASGMTLDFRETQPEKLFRFWPSKLTSLAPLAVLPTRTHGSIIDPERNSKGNDEDIVETAEEKALLGNLILEALNCPSFEKYQSIQDEWFKLSEETAERRHHVEKGDSPEYFHQYMQMNTRVADDFGNPVNDYFLEFFSNTSKANDDANVYLHGSVIEDVKKNIVDAWTRNLYFDRTDLIDEYYKMLPAKTPPVLYMSISAASPGNNVNYFERERLGAEQQVPIHMEDANAQRWLHRNTTHFVDIIIPRVPNANVFKLTNFTDT